MKNQDTKSKQIIKRIFKYAILTLIAYLSGYVATKEDE